MVEIMEHWNPQEYGNFKDKMGNPMKTLNSYLSSGIMELLHISSWVPSVKFKNVLKRANITQMGWNRQWWKIYFRNWQVLIRYFIFWKANFLIFANSTTLLLLTISNLSDAADPGCTLHQLSSIAASPRIQHSYRRKSMGSRATARVMLLSRK